MAGWDETNRPNGYTPDEWANLNFYGDYCDISMELDELLSYLKEFQNYIQVTHHHLESGRISGHDALQLEQMKYNFQHTHGNILRQSTIISLYILFEIGIDRYCRTFSKHLKTKLKATDFKGDVLERFKTYANKVINIPFDFSSDLWNYVVGLHEVRNCLVHSNGIVENFGKRKVIEQFSKRQNLIIIKNDYFIDVTFNGCTESIEQIDRFFVTITELAFDAYPGRYRLKKADEFTLPIVRR